MTIGKITGSTIQLQSPAEARSCNMLGSAAIPKGKLLTPAAFIIMLCTFDDKSRPMRLYGYAAELSPESTDEIILTESKASVRPALESTYTLSDCACGGAMSTILLICSYYSNEMFRYRTVSYVIDVYEKTATYTAGGIILLTRGMPKTAVCVYPGYTGGVAYVTTGDTAGGTLLVRCLYTQDEPLCREHLLIAPNTGSLATTVVPISTSITCNTNLTTTISLTVQGTSKIYTVHPNTIGSPARTILLPYVREVSATLPVLKACVTGTTTWQLVQDGTTQNVKNILSVVGPTVSQKNYDISGEVPRDSNLISLYCTATDVSLTYYSVSSTAVTATVNTFKTASDTTTYVISGTYSTTTVSGNCQGWPTLVSLPKISVALQLCDQRATSTLATYRNANYLNFGASLEPYLSVGGQTTLSSLMESYVSAATNSYKELIENLSPIGGSNIFTMSITSICSDKPESDKGCGKVPYMIALTRFISADLNVQPSEAIEKLLTATNRANSMWSIIVDIDPGSGVAQAWSANPPYAHMTAGGTATAESLFAQLGFFSGTLTSVTQPCAAEESWALVPSPCYTEFLAVLSMNACQNDIAQMAGCASPYDTTKLTGLSNARIHLKVPYSLGSLSDVDLQAVLQNTLTVKGITQYTLKTLILLYWELTESALSQNVWNYLTVQITKYTDALKQCVSGKIPIVLYDSISFVGANDCRSFTAAGTVPVTNNELVVIVLCNPEFSIYTAQALPSITNPDNNTFRAITHELTHALINSIDTYNGKKVYNKADCTAWVTALNVLGAAAIEAVEPVADCLALLVSYNYIYVTGMFEQQQLLFRRFNLTKNTFHAQEENDMTLYHSNAINCSLRTTVPIYTSMAAVKIVYHIENTLDWPILLPATTIFKYGPPADGFKITGETNLTCRPWSSNYRDETVVVGANAQTIDVEYSLTAVCGSAVRVLPIGRYLLTYSHLVTFTTEAQSTTSEPDVGVAHLNCHTEFNVENLITPEHHPIGAIANSVDLYKEEV